MQKLVFSIIVLLSYSLTSIAIAVEPTSLPPTEEKVNPHKIKGTTAGSGVDLTTKIKKKPTNKNKCKKTPNNKCINKNTTIKGSTKKIAPRKAVKL